MNCGIDLVWCFSDKFHNINFACCWPALLSNILSKHPEGGPNPLSIGELDTRFDSSILPGMESLCLDARGRIWTPTNRCFFLTGFDHQHSILHTNIFGPIGISFPFLIAPAATTKIKRPVFQIQFSAIEFIMPGDGPTRPLPFGSR